MSAVPESVPSYEARHRGVLLGAAVGDALGLPAEGLSPARLRHLYHGPWRHRLLWGRGMLSDDTEHVVFVAQSLLAHPDSADSFARRLGWSLRWWLLGLPAGVGLGTLRAIGRLWLGFGTERSGVASAGNGPAMRVAPIGAFFAAAPAQLDDYVRRSALLTHRDDRARVAALAVARIAAWSLREEPMRRPPLDRFVELLGSGGEADEQWRSLVQCLRRAAESDLSVAELALQLGLERGVTGYSYHTVPIATYAWFRHFGDFRASLISVFECGGDTDTVGAIVGALAGSVVGEAGIPAEWIDGIADWPRGPHLLRELGDRLAAASRGEVREPVRYFWPGVIPRNILFLLVVLAHGFRRLAPPYAGWPSALTVRSDAADSSSDCDQGFEGICVAHWEVARFAVARGRKLFGPLARVELWQARFPEDFVLPAAEDPLGPGRQPPRYFAMKVRGRLGPIGRLGHKAICRRELLVSEVLTCTETSEPGPTW